MRLSPNPTRALARAFAALSLVMPAVAPAAAERPYPSRAVELQVPFAVGGTTDLMARIIADPLAQALGQSVIVSNKPGAGGAVGTAEIARYTPDGYHLGVATVSSMVANPAMNPRLAYDPIEDFTPIVNIAGTPILIAVHPGFPAANHEQFLALLKARPDEYAYASSGTGGFGHLAMELYMSLAGVRMQHVPYRGAGPMLNDVIAGQVPVVLDNLPSSLPFIKSGRLIPIVISGAQRHPELPDVPTFSELGLEQANKLAYYGIIGPRGLPEDVVRKVQTAVQDALTDPKVLARIESTGSFAIGQGPAEFRATLAADLAVFKDVVRRQGIAME